MKKSLFVFIGCLFITSWTLLNGQDLKVAAAVSNITSNPMLLVSGGIGTPKKATEKNGNLFARAMVLEKGGVRIAIRHF